MNIHEIKQKRLSDRRYLEEDFLHFWSGFTQIVFLTVKALNKLKRQGTIKAKGLTSG